MIAKDDLAEYVVTLLGGAREPRPRTAAQEGPDSPTLRAALEAIEGVVVLDTLDETTALVRAEQTVIERLARERPDLLIEPNIPYHKIDSPR